MSNLGKSTMVLGSSGKGDLAPSFTPNQLTASSPSAEMSVTIPPSAEPSGRVLTVGIQTRTDDGPIYNELAYVRVLTALGFTAALSPTGGTVLRGGTVNTVLSVTRTGGYTGFLSVQVQGLPTGVTIDGASIGNGSRDTITFQATSAASAGVSTVRFVVQGSGVTTQTVSYTLTVADPPGYTLTPAATSQTVTQGSTGTAIGVNIARQGGFAGAVTLAVDSLPQGVTAAVTSPGTGTSGQMVFTAAATAARGTYPLSIRSTASGLANQTAAFSLTVAESGGFTIAPETASQLVTAGQTGAPVRVSVTRQGGFTGAVSLAVSPLPTGVSVATTNPGTGTTGSFAFTALSSAPAGTYATNVVASASGARDQTTPFTLIVAAAPAVSLTLTAPSTLQPTRGGSVESIVNVSRGGWTGTVALEVSGAPSGMTASFSPASTTGNFVTLRLELGPTVALGTYTLQIRATGANGTTATATVTVIVQA